MDTQSLFRKSHKKEKPKDSSNIKSAAIDSSLEDKLLAYSLKSEKHISIRNGSQDDVLKWVSQGSVNYGLISSGDFALLKGGWKIVPSICKANSSPSKNNLLFFNKNLSGFENIAVKSGNNTAYLILRILLKEVYQMEPQFVNAEGSIANLLEKYDAILTSGMDAVNSSDSYSSFIDISEEWYLLTGLPMVNGFWIANEISYDKNDILHIIYSSKHIFEKSEEVCKQAGIKNLDQAREYLKSSISNVFGARELESLEEMYRYAFFYGFTEYVPELDFIAS